MEASKEGLELRLSVVIPTYNGRDVLADCLTSVTKHRPAGTEVIVVDDASTDGTSEWLQSEYPQVRLVRLSRNSGFCTAINAGIRTARAPVVQTLNNDTVVTAGWVEAGLKLFDDPTVGSVAPLVWLFGQEGQIDSAGDQYHLCGWAMNRGHGQTLSPAFTNVAEVLGASASAGFFRRDALLRVGLFAEHFGAYYDDVDLAFRLRAAGYRCLYNPETQVYHRLHHSYDHANPALIAQASRNEERVFWGNLPFAMLCRGLVLHGCYVGANFIGRCLRREYPVAYLRGKVQVLNDWHTIRARRIFLGELRSSASGRVEFPVLMESQPVLRHVGHTLLSLIPIWAYRGVAIGMAPVREPRAFGRRQLARGIRWIAKLRRTRKVTRTRPFVQPSGPRPPAAAA